MAEVASLYRLKNLTQMLVFLQPKIALGRKERN